MGRATGFLVETNGNLGLVTNYHVLSGRNPVTGKVMHSSLAVPDTLNVQHNLKEELGTWNWQRHPIIDEDGTALWLEHPEYGSRLDVAVLPISLDAEFTANVLPLESKDVFIDIRVGDAVHVLGFPLALAGGGGAPIWKSGSIASEPELLYNNLPSFLIDATTRPSMSGSIVIARRAAPIMNEEGRVIGFEGRRDKWLGVYSSRIHPDSEIGVVWQASEVTKIIRQM